MAKRKRNLSAEEKEQARIDRLEHQAHLETLTEEKVLAEVAASESEQPVSEAAAEVDTNASELEQEAAAEPEVPAEQVDSAEADPEDKPDSSVVAVKFKTKYIENARLQGIPGKAAKRSNWDWLSQQLAAECLDDKHKIDINKFLAVLDANGVDHSKWTNRNKGWEGRLRMTGRVALQKIVANGQVLKYPDGDAATPPPDFVARFKTKE